MTGESIVYFVVCSDCGDKVPIPPQAVGKNRTDLWNVVSCANCGNSLDYDCQDVAFMPLIKWQEMILLQQ